VKLNKDELGEKFDGCAGVDGRINQSEFACRISSRTRRSNVMFGCGEQSIQVAGRIGHRVMLAWA
jgi:hypothetical protein